MGWSGGTFTRVHDWTTDEGSAIDIEASRMDAEDDNFESGINACIHKGGTNTPTANLPMGGYRHTGVDDAAALTDYASAADVIDQHLSYYVDSGAGNIVTLTPDPAITAYTAGQRFVFKANYSHNAISSINVNSLGNKAIKDSLGHDLRYGIKKDGIYEVVYNGTDFQMVSPTDKPQIKVATQDEDATSDTTLSDHAYGLNTWRILADTYYQIDGLLNINAAGTGGGIAMAFDISQNPQSAGGFSIFAIAQTGNTFADANSQTGVQTELEVLPDSSYYTVRINGFFLSHATTAGLMDFQWCQHTSSTDFTRIKQGSYIRVTAVDIGG